MRLESPIKFSYEFAIGLQQNLPRTITFTVATPVADAPLCVLVPVHLYIPSWVGNTAFVMERTDVMLPSVYVSGDTCVITGSTGVPSIGVNGRGSVPTNSHSMVGVKIPVEVHTRLTESPSIMVMLAEPMMVAVGVAAWKEEVVTSQLLHINTSDWNIVTSYQKIVVNHAAKYDSFVGSRLHGNDQVVILTSIWLLEL